MSEWLVEAEGLEMAFTAKAGVFAKSVRVPAVRGVDLRIRRGETLALVGESGSGKSTLGRCLLRLLNPTAGRVRFDGKDITELGQAELKPFRRRMQIVFQDPYSSLNPRMTVGSLLEEPLVIHRLLPTAAARAKRVEELLTLVGLSGEMANRYPHEFSGGQRQRIGIARAIAVEPEFIVCDEPVSALDVSIQAQIVGLLMDLQKRLGLTYLFISHDLRVVEQISHRVAVMYFGQIIETADRDSLFKSPLHPYTQLLLASVPVPDPANRRKRILLPGEPPKPSNPPSGCHFHPRCPRAESRCREEAPTLMPRKSGANVSCLLVP